MLRQKDLNLNSKKREAKLVASLFLRLLAKESRNSLKNHANFNKNRANFQGNRANVLENYANSKNSQESGLLISTHTLESHQFSL